MDGAKTETRPPVPLSLTLGDNRDFSCNIVARLTAPANSRLRQLPHVNTRTIEMPTFNTIGTTHLNPTQTSKKTPPDKRTPNSNLSSQSNLFNQRSNFFSMKTKAPNSRAMQQTLGLGKNHVPIRGRHKNRSKTAMKRCPLKIQMSLIFSDGPQLKRSQNRISASACS